MDEYKGILADQILRDDINSKIICIGERTLVGPAFNYINSNFDGKYKESAIKAFIETALLPKGLKRKEILEGLKLITPEILERTKIVEEKVTVKEFLRGIEDELFGRGIGPSTRTEIEKAIGTIFRPHISEELTPNLAKELIEKHFEPPYGTSPITFELKEKTAQARVNTIKQKLQQIAESKEIKISEKAKISLTDIITDINNDKHSSFYIVISHDPDMLREFAYKLGYNLYWSRRNEGIITPIATFIFDEADEFMPGEWKEESYG